MAKKSNVIIDKIKKTVTKQYKEYCKFEWELKALTKLNGLCSPKIISYDKEKLEIIMEFITYEKIDIYNILNGGNEAVYNYAKALYDLKTILIENGISYGDWKNEHQLYDLKNNKLWLIDYDADECVYSADILKDQKAVLNMEFSFLNTLNYSDSSSFKKFVDKQTQNIGCC